MKLAWAIAGSAVAGGVLLWQLLRHRSDARAASDAPASDSHIHLDRKIVIPTAMAAASIAAWMKMSHGNTLKYTFVPSMIASWVLYMATYRKRMPDAARVVQFYFLSLAWQLVHFVEENSTGFRYRWPTEIFGARPYGDRQYVAINALSYAVFIIGGLALMTRRSEFSLPAVFFALMGVMYNGVQHPIYAYMVKGYFPGLFTGLVDLIIGPFLLHSMFARPEKRLSATSMAVAA